MESLKNALDAFCKIDGVKQALLADANGDVLESVGDDSHNLSSPSSLIISILGLCTDMPIGCDINELTQSYIEFQDINLICVPVAGGYFLSIIAASGVNLGRIRLEIKKNKKIIEAAVA